MMKLSARHLHTLHDRKILFWNSTFLWNEHTVHISTMYCLALFSTQSEGHNGHDSSHDISQLLSHVEVGCLANPGASKLNLVIKCFKITTHLIYLLNCITGTSLEVPNSYILKYRSYKRVAWLYVYRYWSSVRSEEMKSACTYIHVGGKLMYAVFYSLWCTYFTCLHNPQG